MDQKVQEVYYSLDAFELRNLATPKVITNFFSFKIEIANIQANFDVIFSTPDVEPQAALSALGDNTVMGTIFNGDDAVKQPEHACSRGKIHCSSK